MTSKESPEDRLLKLIKGEPKKKADKRIDSVNYSKLFQLKVSKVLVNAKIFSPRFFRLLNIAFIVLSSLVTIYIAYLFLFVDEYNLNFIEDEKVYHDTADTSSEAETPEIQKYNISAGKQLFSEYIKEERIGSKDESVDIAKKFNLVGIIAGEDPQAIIEDLELNKTHYLYEGQTFNGARVVSVEDGRVVIVYNGQKIVLVL